jgi:hypothetical protein
MEGMPTGPNIAAGRLAQFAWGWWWHWRVLGETLNGPAGTGKKAER